MASSFRRRRPLTGVRKKTFAHACGVQGFTLTETECMTPKDPTLHLVDVPSAGRRQRRDESGELLDWLMDLSDDPRRRFMRLHERPTGHTHDLYPIPESMARYFDDAIQRRCAHRADIVLQARRALRRECPDWSAVVESCCFEHPNVKQAAMAERVGVSQPVVSKRMRQGLRWLQQWCLTEMSRAKGA